MSKLRIRLAAEHNLQDISVEIPHHQLIAVVGVSGSGKSSLAFDVIAREGQRRYLETLSAHARQFADRLRPPHVESIDGLAPVVTISQKTRSQNPRSTVGTLSDLYDLLRLLYARLGDAPEGVELSRSLFSFNTPAGACPQCQGLGLEEKISIEKLVADSSLSLREGALAPTLPNGYIMYSQVTVDVLNTVCEAHGFNVDIPWQELTPEQREVILNGSTRLKVPFGKHSLESRLKWTGIAAKPREEGFYKGMLPIMTDILRRDRNANILKYAESLPCSACDGQRLRSEARAVMLKENGIGELVDLSLKELGARLENQSWLPSERAIAEPICEKMMARIALLDQLGLSHLSLSRPAPSLSGGEAQRIRLVNQVTSGLSHVLYVFDEPSIGLHAQDNHYMLEMLLRLVARGNTVLVVEHDEATIRASDWIIDIGPKAGTEGGQLLYSGPTDQYLSQPLDSPTWRALQDETSAQLADFTPDDEFDFVLDHCSVNNLQDLTVTFKQQHFNVVTGISGAGKSSLVHGCLKLRIEAALQEGSYVAGGAEFQQLVTIDQSPIGRTPRSNPATYTGLAAPLRDLFAKTPAAQSAGLKGSAFSFNSKGGRCETCQGAGRISLGMHFMGPVEVLCGTCNGKRFKAESLDVHWNGKNIFEVLEMRVSEALNFFSDQPKIRVYLEALQSVGLGYITLGQPSTTLSGGEAQRVKLATHLRQKRKGKSLYLFDEPTIGLHKADIKVLLKALRKLTEAGHTVICIEHDLDFICQADWVVDLGPGRGAEGGQLVAAGSPRAIADHSQSLTGKYLAGNKTVLPQPVRTRPDKITLTGVRTHQLKNISVTIPRNQLTVVTGVSGSGKSSLAFSTLFAEGSGRFSESLSTYARTQLRLGNAADLDEAHGIGPVVAIGRRHLSRSPRSIVATQTGLYDLYRLLFSRVAQLRGKEYTLSHFSFNHQLGACPDCDGLGHRLQCDPEKLISDPANSLAENPMVQHKVGKFYGNPDGQYVATFRQVAKEHGWDVSGPFQSWTTDAKKAALYGTGTRSYEVIWHFKNKTRSGTQEIKVSWDGFCNLVNEEFIRKQHNKNIEALTSVMSPKACGSCNGQRLKPELLAVRVGQKSISDLLSLSTDEVQAFLSSTRFDEAEATVLPVVRSRIFALLSTLNKLGLGYLQGDRAAQSLSGGEAQRVRLSGQLSANLYGVTYVLDEPTIGLHQRDVSRLLEVLRSILQKGNTLVLVEHDEEVIAQADHVIELGPEAGVKGGHVVFSGSPKEAQKHQGSVTGALLNGHWVESAPAQTEVEKSIQISQARANNLQSISVNIASEALVAVTGISGSGKTSLVRDVLYVSSQARRPVNCKEIVGLEQFDRILMVDQEPISNHSLSTPATYTGLLDELRKLYFKTESAQKLDVKKSVFSYVSKDGRCPTCLGHGQIKTSMDFMGDLWSVCEACRGTRFGGDALRVEFCGLTIADALNMTAGEAAIHFSEEKSLSKWFRAFDEVGLSHVKLNQSAKTLSGGEAQRLKLAVELIHHRKGKNLYLFDEPSTGLHAKDVARLLELYRSMVEAGHTIVYVEHHRSMIKAANQVIELERGNLLSS